MIVANLMLALALATTPTPAKAPIATVIAGFLTRLDSIATTPFNRRAESIREYYLDTLALVDPDTVIDADLDDLLLASLTAGGLAHDREIATHTRAIFNEMNSRNLVDRRLSRYMLELYVSLRDFNAARKFHVQFGERFALESVPAVTENRGLDKTKRTILVPGQRGALRLENFDTPQHDFILVIADPACHFTLDAVTAIQADPQLRDYFAQHSRWLAPDGVRLDPKLADTWNATLPDYPLVFVDDVRTWPDIDYWGTPTFYIFVEGRVVQTIRGWPEGGRAGELKQALGISAR